MEPKTIKYTMTEEQLEKLAGYYGLELSDVEEATDWFIGGMIDDLIDDL